MIRAIYIGIPLIALLQGIVSLLGYYIFLIMKGIVWE